MRMSMGFVAAAKADVAETRTIRMLHSGSRNRAPAVRRIRVVMWATLSSRDIYGWPVPGLLASGTDGRAFPEAGALPVADFASAAIAFPGHSGGTAPVSHRTSHDHPPDEWAASNPPPRAHSELRSPPL